MIHFCRNGTKPDVFQCSATIPAWTMYRKRCRPETRQGRGRSNAVIGAPAISSGEIASLDYYVTRSERTSAHPECRKPFSQDMAGFLSRKRAHISVVSASRYSGFITDIISIPTTGNTVTLSAGLRRAVVIFRIVLILPLFAEYGEPASKREHLLAHRAAG